MASPAPWLFRLLPTAGLVVLLAAGAWPAGGQSKAPAAAPASAPKPSVRKLLADARALQRQYRDSEALDKYEQVLRADAKNYEALWQAALLNLRIGRRYTDETRKSAYFTMARGYAERSWALKQEGAESNYAVALTLYDQATLLRAKDRLQAYRDMKPYVFLAVARRPDWSEAWQLLGRWHYRVDHYNLLERAFSVLFLGGKPGGASSRQAIDALQRAKELSPQRMEVYFDLARVFENQNRRAQALDILRQASLLTPVTTEELEISRRCRNLRQKLERKVSRQAAGAPK
ncbi:hypothetical protein HER32_00145 [Hymenobacter sp. BT18]|uniref:hypothetical protein n=1 Tax=Hymenobacter sp. BT18 TaxID=2835648 RepID=UPI00143E802B|nr:hypothetical protein [Hymenobacter sp. BT18]QIX59686.1 hypothetical protein HER32_00145 [Hymenobacter sp. BT18]